MAKAQTEAPSRVKTKKEGKPPYVGTVEELQKLAAKGALQGIYEVPLDVYHAGPGVSSSELKDILRSPMHYQASKNFPKQTDSMRLGSLIHIALLEPHLWDDQVAVEPQVNKRTKEGKETLAAFEKENAGKLIVSEKEKQIAKNIAKEIEANPLAKSVLGPGRTEIAGYLIDSETGVLQKVRADHICRGFIIDVKSTKDASYQPFERQIGNMQWHLSGAYYLDVFKQLLGSEEARGFAWLAVETEPPHGVRFFAAEPDALEVGRREYRRGLKRYAKCTQSGKWPGYPAEFVNIGLPRWYREGGLV